MKAIEGILEDLDRSSHVSGTEDSTSTTHISIFKIGEYRVLLKSKSPAMISNGDTVRVVGIESPGQFTGIACKNLTTNWSTQFRGQGCAKFILIFFILITLFISIFFLPFIIMTGICGFILYKVLQHDNSYYKAHKILNKST